MKEFKSATEMQPRTHRSFQLKAVLFDFDGTLTKPGSLDFSLIKKSIGCPAEKPILEFIEGLSCDHLRSKALATLNDFEEKGAETSIPNQGAEGMVRYLKSLEIKVGIISRNGLGPIKKALENFKALSTLDFDVIISRDDAVKPKPSEEGVWLAARKLEVQPEQIMVVGDYVFDIQAGQKAGAVTVWLTNHHSSDHPEINSDFTISQLGELKEIIRQGLPLTRIKSRIVP